MNEIALKQLPADTQLEPRLEKTYAITLTESELTIAVTALWYLGRAEREHFRQIEGKFDQVATRQCATEALADRFAKLVKAP